MTALADITAAVAAAQQALAEGAIVELDGLEAAAARVCEAASEAPAEDRPSLAAGLAALAEELDRLAADIARQGEAAQRCRAASAYGAGGES